MERRSSRNEAELSGVKTLEILAEKKPVSEVGSEHRVHLEGLRFQDQTHRKLKVRVVFIDDILKSVLNFVQNRHIQLIGIGGPSRRYVLSREPIPSTWP
jgi:amino acid transporter